MVLQLFGRFRSENDVGADRMALLDHLALAEYQYCHHDAERQRALLRIRELTWLLSGMGQNENGALIESGLEQAQEGDVGEQGDADRRQQGAEIHRQEEGLAAAQEEGGR